MDTLDITFWIYYTNKLLKLFKMYVIEAYSNEKQLHAIIQYKKLYLT